MNKPPNPSKDLSACHQAPVKLGGTGDFDDSDRAVTQYYVCSQCDKPCDLFAPPKAGEPTHKYPDYWCPICDQPFKPLKKSPTDFINDPEDIEVHYWWHKLEGIKS